MYLCLQDLDVAIIKATTSQFHVVPKEKHVRSELPNCPPSTVAMLVSLGGLNTSI